MQRKKTGGRKRRKRRDVDVRNGREMVAGLTRKWMVLRIESWKPACEAGQYEK
ncbi:MAG: hypothetical protein IJ920_09240 [Paludibacteraceae bacterium]|nr:hypothetical protein [Paludibacteraceae bacterium]